MKIAHLTSVHDRSDVRIFTKECCSLAAAGYEVHLVTADGKGNSTCNAIRIVDVGRTNGRLKRILTTSGRVLREALRINADLYHLHDPELLPAGVKLKSLGKRVIFDAHEDFPKQLLDKPYLGRFSARTLSASATLYERYACAMFDGVVAATPLIRDKFLQINKHTVDVKNFPLLQELAVEDNSSRRELGSDVCYLGGLSETRGIREIVDAMNCVRSAARLNLCGSFSEASFQADVQSRPGWARVNYCGFLDRLGVREVLRKSFAGLVTLHPTQSYVEALPVKLFEYMAAGIPAVASDFRGWREIVEREECGLCVDPLQPEAIAQAIDYLAEHPDQAKQMGDNGRRAVVEKFNWRTEESSLLRFYASILGKAQASLRAPNEISCAKRDEVDS